MFRLPAWSASLPFSPMASPKRKKTGTSKPAAKKQSATKKAASKKATAKKAGARPGKALGGALAVRKSKAGAAGPGKSQATGSALAQQHERALKFAVDAARLLTDDKCREVVVLDVRGRSQVTDFTVVATGTSDRQMKAAGEHVDKLGDERGMRLYRHNLRESNPTWVILDFVDVVVHVFEPDARLYYDIEMLWGDAPRVAWERAGDLKAKRDARAAGAADEDGAEGAGMSRNRAGLRRGEML